MANEFKIKNGLIISATLPTAPAESTVLVIDSNGVVKTKEVSTGRQAIGINAIPATLDISTFLTSNSWRDAFVTIPLEYDGWTITGLDASYGDKWPDETNSFRIEIRDNTNSVASSNSYSHQATRAETQPNIGTQITLTQGYTINVVCTESEGLPTGGDSQGYSVTLDVRDI